MKVRNRIISTLAVCAGLATALSFAPVAAAAPQCTQIGPYTTQCETKGSTSINTSPNPNNFTGPYGQYPGGFIIGGFPILGGF